MVGCWFEFIFFIWDDKDQEGSAKKAFASRHPHFAFFILFELINFISGVIRQMMWVGGVSYLDRGKIKMVVYQ